MMYDAYQRMADAGDQVRLFAENANTILSAWTANPYAPPMRRMAAYYELVALAGFSHSRPGYEIDAIEIHGEPIPVEEMRAHGTPFCDLLRFRREGGENDPKILLVAPMSGHFATLLRGTIRTLLHDHQVFITDWKNPRNVRFDAGGFSLDDYTQHLIDFIRFIGEDCHVVAVQLCAFLSMNVERHTKSFVELFERRVAGVEEKADAIRDFYREYFAIMDMSADFYLETVEQVFQRFLLPQGLMKHKGRKVEPRAIKKTFLLTVEGEKDDICAPGQTLAAQDLCSGLRPYMKTHHLQAGVGHYGVFSGRRWETQVYPVLRNHIQSSR